MSERLKIYACSGIGDTEQAELDYWTDNTKTVSNTKAVNSLFALINRIYAEVLCLKLQTKEIVERLNTIDVLVVTLYYAQEYANNPELLAHAGEVIGYWYQNGLFEYDSINNNDRDYHLDELFARIEGLMENDYTASKEWRLWWRENILDLNNVGLTKSEQQQIESNLSQALKTEGIGAKSAEDDPDIGKYISDSGSYFLYTFFTDEQINKLPRATKRVVQRKQTTQFTLLKFVKSVYIDKMYGNEEALLNLIRANIIKNYKATPEEIAANLANGGELPKTANGVGSISVTVICAIISAIATVIVGIVKAIINANKEKAIAEYQAISEEAVNVGVPYGDDFETDGLLTSLTTAGGTSLIPFIVVGAVAAIALLFNKK